MTLDQNQRKELRSKTGHGDPSDAYIQDLAGLQNHWPVGAAMRNSVSSDTLDMYFKNLHLHVFYFLNPVKAMFPRADNAVK